MCRAKTPCSELLDFNTYIDLANGSGERRQRFLRSDSTAGVAMLLLEHVENGEDNSGSLFKKRRGINHFNELQVITIFLESMNLPMFKSTDESMDLFTCDMLIIHITADQSIFYVKIEWIMMPHCVCLL